MKYYRKVCIENFQNTSWKKIGKNIPSLSPEKI